jgi:hypothetical protein
MSEPKPTTPEAWVADYELRMDTPLLPGARRWMVEFVGRIQVESSAPAGSSVAVEPDPGELATGLLKRCPRCGKLGDVFLEERRDPQDAHLATIRWRGPLPAIAKWVDASNTDIAVPLNQLFRTDFGCGRCK